MRRRRYDTIRPGDPTSVELLPHPTPAEWLEFRDAVADLVRRHAILGGLLDDAQITIARLRDLAGEDD